MRQEEGMINQTEAAGEMSGSTLKMIAIVTMLVDHIAATLIYRTMNHEMLVNGVVSLEQKDAYICAHIIMYSA